jgi:hypothetical protein
MAMNNQVDELEKLDLHLECKNQCRSSIIRQYIELYPEALAKADCFSNLPLHVLLLNRSSPAELAFYMINKYPAALQQRSGDGWNSFLPLHMECMSQCRSSIIAMCIELYPESLRTADDGGYLPLHSVLWNSSSSVEDALMMIEMHPRGLEVQENDGNLPLHIECMYKSRLSIISKCIELYPEALSTTDLQGCLPLHRLLLNNQSSANQASMLIERYPEELKYPYRGSLPLHMECHSQCRSSIISKCIELYPEILDNKAVVIIIAKVNKDNFLTYEPALLVIFAARPMSLYDR